MAAVAENFEGKPGMYTFLYVMMQEGVFLSFDGN